MTRPLNRPMITLSIMLATIMQTLDSTIANVALPHMQGTLSASQDQIAWVLTAYIVAAAIATPLTGWLCDRFGQKIIFMASIARIHPGIRALRRGELPGGNRRGAASARRLRRSAGAAGAGGAAWISIRAKSRARPWRCGVWASWSGPSSGPTLGGWLTDSYNWRWVFFINVPIGVIAFYGMWRYIRPDRAARPCASICLDSRP